MPIYKQTTEITNIDDLLSSVERDIEEVYFGDKQVFTVWGEYDGTLPAQYSANGDYLADYRIYGASGGVGDRTENILDGNLITNEYPGSTFGKITYNLKPNTSYVLYTSAPRFGGGTLLAIISSTGSATTANNGAWDGNPRVWESDSTGIINILFRGNNSGYDLTQYNYMLTEGSTAPAEYVPFGYGLSLSVTSPKSYTCEVDSLQASTNYAKIAVAELPTAKVGDKITVTVGGTDYSLPVKNVDNSYVYIENMEV